MFSYFYKKPEVQPEPERGDPDAELQILGFHTPDSAHASCSPFCGKLETLLRVCDLKYTARLGCIQTHEDASKHKFPTLRHGDNTVNDSVFITKYLKNTYPEKLAAIEPATPEAAATSLAAQRLIENHLMWAAYYFTWTIDEVWNRWYLTAFDDLPAWLMFVVPGHVRKRVTRDLEGQGMGRHAVSDVLKLANDDLDALCTLLQGRDWLTGDKPTEADCALFGFLDAVLLSTPDSELKASVKKRDVLVKFHQRVANRYYDHPSCLKRFSAKRTKGGSSAGSLSS